MLLGDPAFPASACAAGCGGEAVVLTENCPSRRRAIEAWGGTDSYWRGRGQRDQGAVDLVSRATGLVPWVIGAIVGYSALLGTWRVI